MPPTKPTVHMIGHGHIDPVWGWRWMEGCEEVRATFRSIIGLMKEFPEFRFTASSAAFYAWVREIDPPLFEEIREAVDRGQWEIAGGWWVEPDCNIPHGESFVRQGLYGQRFFMQHFGRLATVGFNPDSFGHAGTLPQILHKQGITAYCYLRPNPGHGEMTYPDRTGTIFHWVSKDGSQILAANIPHSYATRQWEILADIERHITWPYLLPGQTDLLSFYGVGNHGGGPSRVNIRSIKEAQSRLSHLNIQFSDLTTFFGSIEERMGDSLPVIDHDLQYHAVGCYSAVSMVKQLNRLAEHQLMRAERLATVDTLLNGAESQTGKFEDLWREVLFNQFHDILAGSSIEKAYEDVRNSQGKVLHEAMVIEDRSRQRIAKRINTNQPGRSLVVFNPLPWERTEWVTANENRFFEFRSKGSDLPIEILDERGHPVAQARCRGEFPGQKARGFLATVPALGYRTYRAAEREQVTPVALEGCLEAGSTCLENDFWRIEFHPGEGTISRLLDKKVGVEVLERGLEWVILADSSDTWSHGVRGYRAEMGRFEGSLVQLDQTSDIMVSIRLSGHFRSSTQETWVTLYRGLPVIDFRTRLNWQEQFACLKLCYETKIEGGRVFSESPYGYEERATDRFREFPCQAWIDMSGLAMNSMGKEGTYGLAILNDGKYSFDACGRTLRMTILRSPPYRHHEPDPFRNSDAWPFTDQGVQEFRYRLVPHTGSWNHAAVIRGAWELNEPMYLHQESSHPGDLSLTASFLRLDHPSVVASVLKLSEDSQEEMVMRLVETAGEGTEVTIEMPYWEKRWKTLLGPHEIQTLRLHPDAEKAVETTLLEEPLTG